MNVHAPFKQTLLNGGETETPPKVRITLKELALTVAEAFGVSVATLRTNSRCGDHGYIRNCYYWLACHYTHQSTMSIGNYLGRKNTTVVNGRDRIEEQMMVNPKVRAQIEMFMKEIENRHPKLQVPPMREKKGTPFLTEEQKLQRRIVVYLRDVLPDDWLVHHCRNGGMSKRENARAKYMGALAGWPDIEILGERDVEAMLLKVTVPAMYFFEVKTEAKWSKPSEAQEEMHGRLRDLGFRVAVVKTIDEVRAALVDWGVPHRDVLLDLY